MMKRKVQAQRKFAQGAYIPPTSGERRSDVPSSISNIDKQTKSIMCSNMSAATLLDVVSMKNLVPEMVPVVLVERLPESVKKVCLKIPLTNNSQKELPKVPSLGTRNEEPPKPLQQPLLKKKKTVRGNLSGVIQLRSKTISKKMPIVSNMKRGSTKTKIVKKGVALFNRTVLVTKKHPIRSKSPITSGFSTDDDTPLNQVSQKQSNVTLRTQTISRLRKHSKITGVTKKVVTKQKKLLPKAQNLRTSRMAKKNIVAVKKLNRTKILSKSENLTVTSKINDTNNASEAQANNASEAQANNASEAQLNNTSEAQFPIVDNRISENINIEMKSDGGETFYDRTEIERWINDSHSSSSDITQPQELDKTPGRTSVSEPSVNSESILLYLHCTKSTSDCPINNLMDMNGHDNISTNPEQDTMNPNHRNFESESSIPQDTFKIPRPIKISKNDKRISKPIDESNNFEKQSECSSSNYLRLTEIDAIINNKNIISKFCDSCRNCKMFYKLTAVKKQVNHMLSGVARCLDDDKSNDVYVFDDTDSTTQSLIEFRQNRRKSKDETAKDRGCKNIQVDLVPNRISENFEVDQYSNKNCNDKIDTTVQLKVSANTSKPSNIQSVASKKQKSTSMELVEEPQPGPSCIISNIDVTDSCNDKIDTAIRLQVSEKTSKPPNIQSDASKKQKSTSMEVVEEPQPGPSYIISQKSAKLLDAPIFHPTHAEFANPFKYIEKIEPIASKFGMCKIVTPKGFKPDCTINKSSRFTASNQYPAKMFSRWGSSQRELCAIKTHSATQKVRFVRPPLLDGVEIDLVNLFHTVQKMGGLINVINKELWQAVAEKLGFPKSSLVVKKLDQIYVKYILPYDTLTDRERQTILNKVEKEWSNRYKRMLVRARNPLHKQKQLLGESSSDEDEDDEDPELALDEVDDCIVSGRIMTPASFEKVAQTVMQMHFGGLGRAPSPQEVETEYWRVVVLGDRHVSVNTAAIDTGEHGYGFTRQKGDKYAKHPWNLKVMSNSAGSALRSLGPVLSVTVPTLHLGMVFSTSCWHRDPHGLPWIEYMHGGPPKIWYGIPDKQSDRFRRAVEVLCPAFCQNKSIWLPSDILMIPPNLLIEHDVSLSKTVQNPGEFIIIFPKAYSCSICTGYTVSESVYFAPSSWLSTVKTDFQEVRDSFEPTMFSLEQILIAIANDSRVATSTLPFVYRPLDDIINEELENRRQMTLLGVAPKILKHPSKKKTTPWNVRELAECNVCRMTLYLSQVTGIVDKKFDFCLQHALKILETPAYLGKDISGITLTYFYTDEALGAVITKLEKQLLKA